MHLRLIVVCTPDMYRLVQISDLQDVHYALKDKQEKDETLDDDGEGLKLSQLVDDALGCRLTVQFGVVDGKDNEQGQHVEKAIERQTKGYFLVKVSKIQHPINSCHLAEWQCHVQEETVAFVVLLIFLGKVFILNILELPKLPLFIPKSCVHFHAVDAKCVQEGGEEAPNDQEEAQDVEELVSKD